MKDIQRSSAICGSRTLLGIRLRIDALLSLPSRLQLVRLLAPENTRTRGCCFVNQINGETGHTREAQTRTHFELSPLAHARLHACCFFLYCWVLALSPSLSLASLFAHLSH